MGRSHLRPIAFTMVASLGVLLCTVPVRPAAPDVRSLRVQQAGDITYFHVRFAVPKGMAPGSAARLVPQDKQASHVCQRVADGRVPNWTPGMPPPGMPPKGSFPGKAIDAPKGARPPQAPRRPVPVEGIEFTGRLHGKGEVKFVLIYSRERQPSRLERFIPPPPRRQPPVQWVEMPLTLDFDKAEKVALPAEAKARRTTNNEAQWPVRDDLEGLWAAAQIDEFGRLQNEVSEFGFYSFASQAAARKYRVPVRPEAGWNRGRTTWAAHRPIIEKQLYETTTGASAVAESLQLQRMLTSGFRDNGNRTIPIGTIQGITIAEHPWDEMMGDKKPALEPMAKLIPDDNYYLHFKNVRKFIEFSELLDQWGTNLIRAYEVHSRDYRLKERYQQQLCLRSTELGKKFGPLVLRGLAVTGSDAYLREGSDVAIIFHVANRELFLGAVQIFLEETRQKFGARLKESKIEKDGVVIESFTTPQREVSLHRAIVQEYVIYANSRTGLQRILDTYRGKHKALAEARDFQYMRTIFRYDDKDEAGFAYLSDAFIRNLVGPASKIKEKRRLEALTSMYMLHEGALYHAWETGKPPADHDALLSSAGLKAEEVYLPEGKPLVWDTATTTAISDVYNTIHFATPLVELSIDGVTQAEAQAYQQFRMEYLGLWGRYFDPIGMRIALDDKQVKLDTYILPLVANSQYNELRRVTGDGTVRLDLDSIPPQTIGQFLMHLSPNVRDRSNLIGLFGPRVVPAGDLASFVMWALDPVGKWLLVRADDSPVYGQLADLVERQEKGENVDAERIARLVFQMPVLVGLDVKNPLTFAAALAALRTNVMNALPGALTWEPLEKPYKGVSLVRVQATPAAMQEWSQVAPRLAPRRQREPFLPAVYYATIDGAFYLTLNEAMLHDLIDRARDKREGKRTMVEVNSSLYVSPGAAKLARRLVQKYLEKQIHEQALVSAPLWYPLYHAGLLTDGADAAVVRELAARYYGFVPVSPDGAGYVYDRRLDEVRNERHGSPARPKTHKTPADNAPMKQLLEQLRTIRADLRFREDGIHTTLTVDRQVKDR